MTLVSIFCVQNYETILAIWLLFFNRKADQKYVRWGPYSICLIPLLLA